MEDLLANAKRIGQQELTALDKAVWQAQGAAASQSTSHSQSGGGGGHLSSAAGPLAGTAHSAPGKAEVTANHTKLINTSARTKPPNNSGPAQNISLGNWAPLSHWPAVETTPTSAADASSPSAGGTPWTGHVNAGLPAYPSQHTPQLPVKPLGEAEALGQGSQQHPLQPRASSNPGAGAMHSMNSKPAPSVEGGKLVAGFGMGAHAASPPVQEGPLAHYPDFSVVDANKKWQRIQEWVSRDSGATMTAGGTGYPPPPPSMGTAADDAHSVDSTLLELELERTRTSMQAGQLSRTVASVRGPPPTGFTAASHKPNSTMANVGTALPLQLNIKPSSSRGSNRHRPQPDAGQAPTHQQQNGKDRQAQSEGTNQTHSGPPPVHRRTADDVPPLLPPRPSVKNNKPPFAAALQQHMQQQQRPSRPPAASADPQQQPLPHSAPSVHSTTMPKPQHEHPTAPASKDSSRLLGLEQEEGSGETGLAPVVRLHPQPQPHKVPSQPPKSVHANPHLQQYSKLLETSSSGSNGSEHLAAPVPAPVSRASIPTASRQSHGPAAAQDLAQRVELESRLCSAAEQMASTERRYALDKERMQVRIAALEASLASEHELSGRLQQQVASELQRGRALAQAEEQARSAEQRAEAALAGAKKTLDAERRRNAEAIRASAAAATEEGVRLRAALEDATGLERKLVAERETKGRLQRQIANLRKAEEDSRAALARSEAARSEQERRLEAASSQVAAMRGELTSLNTRLAARDEQLLKHVKEVEIHEVQLLRDELASCRAQLAAQNGAQAALRQCVLSAAQCLSPEALAEAFSYQDRHLQGFSASAEQHRELVQRLDAAASDSSGVRVQVAAEDAGAVAARVRELLQQAKQAMLQAERQEAALTTEADATADILRAQLVEAQAKLEAATKEEDSRVAALSAALRNTTGRVEELMEQAASAQAEVLAAEQQAAKGEAALRRQLQEASAHWSELEQEAATWQARAEQAEQQLRELEQQVAALQAQAQDHCTVAETKEQRILELRAALAMAMQGATDAGEVAAQEAAQQRAIHEAEERAAQQAQRAVQQAQQAAEQAMAGAEDRQAQAEVAMQQVQSASDAAVAAAQRAQANAEEQRCVAEATCRKADEAVSELQAHVQSLEGQLKHYAATMEELQQERQDVALALGHLRCRLQKGTAMLWTVGKQGQQEGEGVAVKGDGEPGDAALITDHEHEQLQDGLDASGRAQPLQEVLHALEAEVQQVLEAGKAVGPTMAVVAGGLRKAHAQQQEARSHAEQKHQASQQQVQHLQKELAQAIQAAQREKELLQMDSGARAAHLAELLATAQQQQAQMKQQLDEAWQEAAANQQLAESAAQAQHGLQQQLQGGHQQVERLQQTLQQQREQSAAEVEQARQSLQGLRQQLQEQAEGAAQAQHTLMLQMQQQAEEARHQLVELRRQCASLQRQAATDRCRARVARVRRKGGLTALSMHRQAGRRLRAKLAARNAQLRAGMARLRAAEEGEAATYARLAELEARAQRADALLHKMEDRRAGLESERRALLDKLGVVQGQAADLSRALDAARRTEASLRRELEVTAKQAGQVSAAEGRSATLLEALEGAEAALRESQANAQRLLQEVHALRSAEQQARADLATAHEGVIQLQACIAQQQSSKHLKRSASQSPTTSAPPSTALTPIHAHLAQPQQLESHEQQQATDAAHSRAAIAEAECQMLRRQLRRTQLQLQQLQQQARPEAGTAAAHPAAPASLHHDHLSAAHVSMQLGQQLPNAGGDGESNCAASMSGAQSSCVPPFLSLAHVGNAQQPPSQHTPHQQQQALQIHSSEQSNELHHATALSAKEARIFELRGALAQCRAERGALQAQLQAAGGPGGQAPSTYQLELQQEAADLRQQALVAQRKLCDCQQQLAKAQAAQESSSAVVVELEVALHEAQVSCELQLQQLGCAQQQMLHAVRTVRTELAGYQQHALVDDMTASTQLRTELGAAHKQQHALEQSCTALESELGCARTRLAVLQEEVGALSKQLVLAAQDREQQQAHAERVMHEHMEQQRDELRQELAQQQAATAAAQHAEQEARAEAAAAHEDALEDLAEARAGLAAREEWVASLRAEASVLQDQCSSLQAQLHEQVQQRAQALDAAATQQPSKARKGTAGNQQQDGNGGQQELQAGREDVGEAWGDGSDSQKDRLSAAGHSSTTDILQQLRARAAASQTAQAAAEAARSAAEAGLRESQAIKEAAEAAMQDLVSQLEEAKCRADAREALVCSLQQQCSSAAQGSSEEMCALRERLLEAELTAQEGARALASSQEAQARLEAALKEAEASGQEGARTARDATARAKKQEQLAARLQHEVLELRQILEAQPCDLQAPDADQEPNSAEQELAQQRQQLQQQQALAKREVRVAMVALEEAEASAEEQAAQLKATIHELEAVRSFLEDESRARQGAELALAEKESVYSAQAQAAEEAEAKNRMLEGAVAHWQAHHRSAEARCAELASDLAQAQAAVANSRVASAAAQEAEQLGRQLVEVQGLLEVLEAQAEDSGVSSQLESALSTAQAQVGKGEAERMLLRQQLQEALEVGAALQADGIAVRKRHAQEVARLRAQLVAANAAAEGFEAQQASQVKRQAQYVSEVETLRAHLDASLLEIQGEKRTALALRAECEALHGQQGMMHREQAFSCPLQSDTGNSSWASSSLGVGALSAHTTQPTHTVADPALSQRYATVFGENRELIRMLDGMQTKLKIAKARYTQAEAQLAALTGQVEEELHGGQTAPPAEHVGEEEILKRTLHKVEAYKVALMAAQEQAAISSNQAAEARARISALEAKLLQAQQGRKQKLHASSELLSSLRKSRQQRGRGEDSGDRDQDCSKQRQDVVDQSNGGSSLPTDADVEQQMMEQIRAQQAELQALRSALDASHAARAADSEEAARVNVAWNASVKQVRLLEEQVSGLEQLLQHRTAPSNQQSSGADGQQVDLYQEWSSSSLPSRSGGEECSSSANMGVYDGGAAAAAAMHQQRQLDEVADLWKQACLARAQHVSDLEAELDSNSQQMKAVQKQLASTVKMADKLGRHVQRLEQEQRSQLSKAGIDHEALLAQISSKDEQVRALGAQVSSYEANATQLDQQLAACQVDLKCVRDRIRSKDAQNADLHAQLEQQGARARAREVELARLQAEMAQATASHQRSTKHMDRELGRLVLSLRELLVGAGTPAEELQSPSPRPTQQQAAAAAAGDKGEGQQAQQSESSSSSRGVSGVGSHGAKPLQQLHSLLDVVADALSKRDQQAAYAAADLRACRGEARRLEADVKALEARVMAQSDSASSEREQLMAAEQEAANLRARLARKEADFSTVEAEIQRQIGDYERLKARLLQQERDGGRLAAAQDVLAHKCDELQAALAAKQADCAAAAVRASQLQEALSVSRQNHQATQERLKVLEQQKDADVRSNGHASIKLAATQAELEESALAYQALQAQLDKKGAEIKELHQMLKAWEAMRLSKDAQIASLIERCKRQEEDAAEKARTVDALRRKVSGVGRSCSALFSDVARPVDAHHSQHPPKPSASVRRSCGALFGAPSSLGAPLPPSASAMLSRESSKASVDLPSAAPLSGQQHCAPQPQLPRSRSSAASLAHSSNTSSAVQ